LTKKDTLNGDNVVPGFALPLAELFSAAVEDVVPSNGSDA
jgi:hypothetical protein